MKQGLSCSGCSQCRSGSGCALADLGDLIRLTAAHLEESGRSAFILR